MNFNQLGLTDRVLEGIKDAGFETCTNVQEKVLPVSLGGRDVMVQSKTGSGKTAVYLLTIMEQYAKRQNAGLPLPVSLVIAPTRELALQIEEDAKLLSKHLDGFRVGCFYGGVGYGRQNEEISSGLALYVGTPGRLIDFAQSRKIDFRQFSIVVIDEADRMFDMGFYPDVQRMFSLMVKREERQTLLLSATLSTRVRNLAWEYMNSPVEIESQPEEITVKNITQELFHVTKDEKFQLLLDLLKKEAPRSCLIFTNTKGKAVEVSKRLTMNGYRTAYLMGDMAQKDRLQALSKMKDGKLDILVATDIAARGLQIDDLELVVNYDIPEDFEAYVHRIGRTARAGKSGKAITLACEEYIYGLEAIENYIQMKIPVLWADEIGLEHVEDKSEGFRLADRPRGQRKGSSGRSSSDRSHSERRRPARTGEAAASGKKGGERKKKELDYDRLAKMSPEERMSYYKKAYGDKSAKKEAAVPQKTRPTKPAPQDNMKKTPKEPQKPRKEVTPMPKVQSAPVQKTVEPRKKGFISKVLSLFRRDK